MNPDDIDSKMAKGAAWMVSFKLIDRSIGLLSTIILVRLLVPADFGLVAMAMLVVAVLELFGAFGLDVSLIQNANAERRHFDTAWTINFAFSLTCAIALVLLAHPAAVFYGEPRVSAVMCVLAIGHTAAGFGNIGTVAFRREMRFDREFRFLLANRLMSFLVTVTLAVWFRSYWALVCGQLVGKCTGVALSYYVHDYRPRFSLEAKSELFHFSKWLVINNALLFFNSRAADFVIGKLAGAQALGLYSVAYEISSLPTTELVAPINRAALPGYSRLARDRKRLSDSFLNVISMIALFAMPAGIGIALLADVFVPAILGWKWLAAIPLIQIFALYGIIVALQTNIIYVYLAVGKPRVVTYVAATQFVCLLTLLLPAAVKYGAVGAAWAFLGTVVIMLPINQALIARQLNLSITRYGSQLWRPFVACLAMALGVYATKGVLGSSQQVASMLTVLFACVFAGAATYVSVLYGLWRLGGRPNGAERFCLSSIEQACLRVGFRVNLVGH
jgi:lipopolysaccharide exporter